MLKIYKVWLQQFYLLSLWFELSHAEPGGSTGDRLHRLMIDQFYKTSAKGWVRFPSHGALVQSILNRTTMVDMDKILPELHTLLLNEAHRSQFETEGDMINLIVNELKLPYFRNHLSGNNLDRLRHQLLLPQERAEFQRLMANKEMACVQCGHQFNNGEMSTYTEEGFVCSNCYTPNQMGCKHCEQSAHVPDKLRDGIRKVGDCGCRERKKGIAEELEVDIPTRVTPMGDNSVADPQLERNRPAAIPSRYRTISFEEARRGFATTDDNPFGLSTAAPVVEPVPVASGSSDGTWTTFSSGLQNVTEPPPPTPRPSRPSNFLATHPRTRQRPTNRTRGGG